ncbi:C40 family peptidase [Marinobacterium rhizophilum]|uniref:C40 family peptidase n=1 Tax=Marinobacterium rhizophilum TaxID=420402 RepID=A0ABY5HQJ7_9GAMM|nr:NlpC/P60 family protein [Marinobacterium rhizophilum]UTW13445.1 C40 family peptidase [Marinobacterium rhizophilum]
MISPVYSGARRQPPITRSRSRVLLAALCIALLQGCASSNLGTPTNTTEQVAPDPEQQTISQLYELHRQWRGTPYRYGGTSRNGIDCSALIQQGFRRHFNQELPRTTEGLLSVGDVVSAEELRPGDLVFFRTGSYGRHAGIYIENGRFLHASTSRGVMISDLTNPYWKRHYWTARRIDRPVSNDS